LTVCYLTANGQLLTASSSPSRRRIIAWLIGAAGLAVAIALVVRAGAPAVLAILERGGWLLLLVIPIRVAALALDALGWRALLGQNPRATPLYLAGLALVREAVSTFVPGRVGGELVGIRMLARHGVPMATSAASVVVEVTLWVFSQVLFAIVGLVLLASLPSAGAIPRYAATGLLILGIGAAAFVVLQRHVGLFGLLHRLLERVAGETVSSLRDSATAIDAEIAAMYRQSSAVVRCVVWLLLSFAATSVEPWLALRALGQPISYGAAVIVESLVTAVQSAAFLVPAGIGAQEASLVLLCAAVGVPAPAALALAITRRGRQIILGIPAVIAWFWTERRSA
jgi:putative membrane protein